MFDHYHEEAVPMRWLKKDLWKAGIAIAGTLFLLEFMVWIPLSGVDAQERVSGLATPVTVQATPTEDATVTALNKEKLAQEVQQLKNQNEPVPFDWLRTNASILLSTLVVVIGALVGLFRWLADRRDEQEKRRDDQESEQKKRAEERFQSVVEGLGSEREEARVGAAITLRTFLLPGYEQFYRQVFDLAVAHLRLPRTSHLPEDQNVPLPLTSLSQALSVVFKEAFPLARSQEKSGPNTNLRTDWYTKWYQSLDARGVLLDNAYLGGASADLERVWMPKASLRKADLWWINLKGAYLVMADFRGAELNVADLSGADLGGANLSEADLSGADLSEAYLHEANFSRAILTRANLSGADFRGDDLITANLEDAASLEDTNLRGVNGLTKEQLEACRGKGAIIDEEPTISASQSTVSTSLPLQSNDVQAQSAPSAQGSLPTHDSGGNSAASSKPSLES
jgi:uncharacterized protein YjbI with pentapeptide repeats